MGGSLGRDEVIADEEKKLEKGKNVSSLTYAAEESEPGREVKIFKSCFIADLKSDGRNIRAGRTMTGDGFKMVIKYVRLSQSHIS